jgi:hypothetical protein
MKGLTMDDSTFLKWALGLVTLLGLTLIGRTHTKATDAHVKIEKERDDNEARLALCYQRIADTTEKTEVCRREIYKDMHSLSSKLMTEVQVKDFVDRSIKPMQDSINAVHSDVKELLKVGK